ncbi:MAG: hypothetical protein JXD18_05420 [Anaerolineae bacterium]|nr:hypothetical protein [Anaerolineae bacterium]
MRKETILLALVLIFIGIYFLLIQLELGIPELDRLWPVFPFTGGMVLMAIYARGTRDNAMPVFWGTNLTLSSVFFFMITLGEQDYLVLKLIWPVFIVITGIAFLAFWLACRPRDWSILFLAIVSILFGGMALAFNLKPELVPSYSDIWPAFPIIVGLILLLRAVASKREAGQ